MKDYLVKIDTDQINHIKNVLNVTWESAVIDDLIIVTTELSIDDILSITGVFSCREEDMGELYI